MTLVRRDEIPDGWTSAPLKSVARLISGGTPDTENESYWANEDGENWVAIGDMSGTDLVVSTEKAITVQGRLSARLVVGQPGTVLLAMYASVGAVSTLGVKASWNQAILGIEPIHARSSSKYLAYSLIASRDQLPYLYRSNTQNNLNASQVGGFRILVPPLDEQRQIAEYLDRETGKIDELIAKQEQLVATLTERRQAVIAQAVTRGLDSNTSLKDSGSVWIGPIPRSWQVVPCGLYTLLIQTGPFGSQLHSEEYVENGVPLVNPMHFTDGRIVTSAGMSVEATKALELSRHALQLDDVIIARRGELGRSAVVTIESVGFLCGTGSAIVRLRTNQIDPRFFQLVFSSRRVRDVLVQYSVGSTMDNLSAATVASLRIPVPLLAEQKEIVAFVESQGARIGVVVEKTREMIALLRERRAALISAAVTGKIDVRGL